MRTVHLTSGAMAALTLAAAAQPIPEIEPFNSAPPGQPGLFGAPFWSAEGSLTIGDVDFYDHGPPVPFPGIFPGPPMITASTYTAPWFSMPPGVAPLEDTFIGFFGPAGPAFPVSTDDDDGPGLNSAHNFGVPLPPALPMFHGVTTFGDPGFTGATSAVPFYRFVVSSGGMPEVEPNGAIPVATPMPPPLAGATATEGFLGIPGATDVDYYSLFIPAGSFVTASVFDFTPVGGPPIDTVLGVFDPLGLPLGLDDDEGPGLNSGLAFFAPTAGVYSFAVTGFPDFTFTGSHTESGPYRLVVSIPTPGALAMLGLSMLALGRRRHA